MNTNPQTVTKKHKRVGHTLQHILWGIYSDTKAAQIHHKKRKLDTKWDLTQEWKGGST